MEFVTPERMAELIGELMDELPEKLFDDLNGGIVLEEGFKMHALTKPGQPLYIMGEYVRSRLGKQIKLYYGSFQRVHSHLSEEQLKDRLRETLRHEFRHHWEHLAGEDDLIVQDNEFLRKYIFGTQR